LKKQWVICARSRPFPPRKIFSHLLSSSQLSSSLIIFSLSLLLSSLSFTITDCLCLQRQWKGAGSRMVSPIWTGKDRGWPTACQQQAHDASAKQPKPNGLLGGSCRSPQRFWSSSIKSRARRVNQRHSTCCIVSLSFRWQSVIVPGGWVIRDSYWALTLKLTRYLPLRLI